MRRRFKLTMWAALTVLSVFFDVFAATYELDAPKTVPNLRPSSGVTICAQNTDIDQTFELMARDASFAQIAATDSLELVLSESADTVRVRVTGILADSTRFDTLLRISDTDTVSTGKRKFLRYESTRIDSSHATTTGTLTIARATGNTHISQIAIGERSDPVAQYFIAKNEMVSVAYWAAGVTTATGITTFELRWYPDWAASRSSAAGMGYEVLDVIVFDGSVEGSQSGHILPDRPLVGTSRYLSRGWLAVFAKSGVDNAAGFAVLTLDIY